MERKLTHNYNVLLLSSLRVDVGKRGVGWGMPPTATVTPFMLGMTPPA